MIEIKFFSLIRLSIKLNSVNINSDAIPISQLLQLSQEKVSTPFIHKLLTNDNKMHVGTIILINGRNIHHLNGLDSIVYSGDIVSLFPPGGGG